MSAAAGLPGSAVVREFTAGRASGATPPHKTFGARNDFLPVPYSVHQDHRETNHRQELSG